MTFSPLQFYVFDFCLEARRMAHNRIVDQFKSVTDDGLYIGGASEFRLVKMGQGKTATRCACVSVRKHQAIHAKRRRGQFLLSAV
jgi:hypothetical protein